MALTCPHCRSPLTRSEKSYRCTQGHSFDLAKEGYLSLLHGRQRGEGRGDTKAMIQARDRVHQAGVFEPLVQALTALPLEKPINTVLELGCGEGFFLDHIARAHGIATRYGLDLSVDAVKLAARRQPDALILRADLLHPLPFADANVDLIQSIFAPRPLAEIQRCLRPGGYALFVFPQTNHWQELRAFVPLAAIGEEKLSAEKSAGFSTDTESTLETARDLTHDRLVDLVGMSPSIFRLNRESPEWPKRIPERLSVTLALRVILLRKN
ncbi:MAG: rRNA ((745)-N(1))-methyltransferase [Verrucomicrobiota bacterium]|jgi:23S rRNA (guanine745-N1)-methyltransferase